MTDTEINIAIAEACGWKPLPEGCFHPDNPIGQRLPDYPNDLNAMHEAVRSLLFSKRVAYRKELQDIVSRDLECGCVVHISECIDATARQRAEAFLRTIGKWKE